MPLYVHVSIKVTKDCFENADGVQRAICEGDDRGVALLQDVPEPQLLRKSLVFIYSPHINSFCDDTTCHASRQKRIAKSSGSQ